ncbi:eugenol synthase 1-like [Cornus florida]|uniref:eugenol synthase 1-like n=1 Tax=Cornus florida TaxID=4283 RepID=UPI00289C39E1|nr:eugenol synthase 1-like [Cornus florida]
MDGGVSKILVFGGTGYVGKCMVKASIKMGHPTYVYGRPLTLDTNPSKLQLHEELQSMGVTIIQGELDEHEKLVSIMKEVDVVISTLAIPQVLDQLNIINAMKIAGNMKRFIPSDFGCEEDRIIGLPPFQACLDKKKKIRRATEEAGIPYTYVSSTCFAEYFFNHLFHPHDQPEELAIYGTGDAKVAFASKEDIAIYTIKVANDPRTCNKTVLLRPPHNVMSQLELVSLWEKKTGRNHRKVHVSEEEIVKLSETSEHPHNVQASILHSIFVKGDTTNFELGEDDIEVSELYPDFEYTKIDQIIDSFVANPPKLEYTAF